MEKILIAGAIAAGVVILLAPICIPILHLELVRDGDTILFKASHVMHMEKIIELI